ncbi:MAG TPA: ABC transporter permease [Actinomycetales bacterium]|nr:ABC transporter permease [Actinomycetales bacterium]
MSTSTHGPATAADLDLSPAPRPAPAVRRIGAQARLEASLVLRNGEQLLLALVLPVLLLVGLHAVHVPSLGPGRRIDVLTPGVLALAVMSTSFTGQAIQTGFDRRYGVLRLLGTTPLGRSGLVGAKVVAVLAVQAVQVVVIGGVGLALGWRPQVAGVPAAVLVVALGTAAFVSLALLMAGTLRAEATLAAANLVWVLLLAGGGVVVPVGRMPGGLAHLAQVLPSGALGEAMRDALLHAHLAIVPCLVLATWTLAAAALTARTFRWD